MINLAVTGGRVYTDRQHVYDVLNIFHESHRDFVLHVGDARGVDEFVREWAYENDVTCIVYIAHWNEYGKAAGPIRNRDMLRNADKLIAFPGGKGTRDCIAGARHIGIMVDYA
jgi:hypothetical protein